MNVPAPSAGRTVSVMLPRARAQACGGNTMGAADFTPYMPDTYRKTDTL